MVPSTILASAMVVLSLIELGLALWDMYVTKAEVGHVTTSIVRALTRARAVTRASLGCN